VKLLDSQPLQKKIEYIKSLGASHVVVVDKENKELSKHSKKFDYLINTLPISSIEIMEAYLGTLKNGGTIIQVGLPDIKEHLELSFFTLVARQLHIAGSIVASVQETKDTLEFHHKHGSKVEVEAFSFEDFPKALHRLEKERPFFRCVVNVKEFTDKHFKGK